MSSPSKPYLEIPLKRHGFWNFPISFFSLYLIYLLVSGILELASSIVFYFLQKNTYEHFLWQEHLEGFICLFFVCFFIGKRFLIRLKAIEPIAFYEQHMTLPRSGESLWVDLLPYKEIIAVQQIGNVDFPEYIIESTKGIYRYPISLFLQKNLAELLILELRRRLLNTRHFRKRLEKVEAYRATILKSFDKSPWLIHSLLICLVGFFAISYSTGDLDLPLGLLRWGANAAPLVAQGDYFRLICSLFFHQNLVHLLLMMGLFIYYGSIIQHLLGWQRALLLILISHLLGSITLWLYGQGLAHMGASRALFGILGAYGWLAFRLSYRMPLTLREQPGLFMWTGLFVLFAMGTYVTGDPYSHAVAFLTGAFFCRLFLKGRKRLPSWPMSWSLQLLTILLSLGYSLGLYQGIKHAIHYRYGDELQLTTTLLGSPYTSNETLYELATTWSEAKDSTKEELELAKACAFRAYQQQPTSFTLMDLYAQLAYRLKDNATAVEYGHRALSSALKAATPQHQEATRTLAQRLANYLKAAVTGNNLSNNHLLPLIKLSFSASSKQPQTTQSEDLSQSGNRLLSAKEPQFYDLQIEWQPSLAAQLADSSFIYAWVKEGEKNVALLRLPLQTNRTMPMHYALSELQHRFFDNHPNIQLQTVTALKALPCKEFSAQQSNENLSIEIFELIGNAS